MIFLFKRLFVGLLLGAALYFGSEVLPPRTPRNFQHAKQIAATLFESRRVTFYCGCRYDGQGQIDLASCGYRPLREGKRARRLEWEHLVPAHHLGGHKKCWREKRCKRSDGTSYGGRACCQKIDRDFQRMEADLHNLAPEIGELNGHRSNYQYGLLPNVPKGQFGQCHFKIDKASKTVEPRHAVRGPIARAYLYMAGVYHINLDPDQQALFKSWDEFYPPELWEIEWNRQVMSIQGKSKFSYSMHQKNREIFSFFNTWKIEKTREK